jgi:hypothetical protein
MRQEFGSQVFLFKVTLKINKYSGIVIFDLPSDDTGGLPFLGALLHKSQYLL